MSNLINVGCVYQGVWGTAYTQCVFAKVFILFLFFVLGQSKKKNNKNVSTL